MCVVTELGRGGSGAHPSRGCLTAAALWSAPIVVVGPVLCDSVASISPWPTDESLGRMTAMGLGVPTP